MEVRREQSRRSRQHALGHLVRGMEGERFPKVAVAEVMTTLDDNSQDDLRIVLKKTDATMRLEKDIEELVRNINAMPSAPPIPREAPDAEHMRMNEFIAETQRNLEQQLDQAYNEQNWWNDRVRSLERVRAAVIQLDTTLNAEQAADTSTGQLGGLSKRIS